MGLCGTERGAAAFSPAYIANALIYALISLYIYYIFFLSYFFALIYYIIIAICYFMLKVSYISLYRTRAGFRVAGRLSGAFLGGLSVKRSFCGRLAGASGRVFPVRAGVGVPLPFSARDQSRRVYSLIVYGGGIWESVVRVSAKCECHCL